MNQNALFKNWISPNSTNLPDFIIGGAMKSGTTSLHKILQNHPDIEITKEELGFFDIDDLLQHPDFNYFDKSKQQWISQSMDKHPELLWNWYNKHFEGLRLKAKMIGEDSPTYLASAFAAKRLALQEKPIKMIFILRHPTKRVISNYLHKLKSGRAQYTLEDTLKYDPASILNRSLYKEQLERYYKYHSKDHIKVITLEELTNNQKNTIKELCDYLNVDFTLYNSEDLKVHANKTKLAKNLDLLLTKNKLTFKSGDLRYSKSLPIPFNKSIKLSFKDRLINKFHKEINPIDEKSVYTINESTQNLLDAYFKKHLEGLDEIVNKNILNQWF